MHVRHDQVLRGLRALQQLVPRRLRGRDGGDEQEHGGVRVRRVPPRRGDAGAVLPVPAALRQLTVRHHSPAPLLTHNNFICHVNKSDSFPHINATYLLNILMIF